MELHQNVTYVVPSDPSAVCTIAAASARSPPWCPEAELTAGLPSSPAAAAAASASLWGFPCGSGALHPPLHTWGTSLFTPGARHRLSLAPRSLLVLLQAAVPVQVVTGWLLLRMPNVQICCKKSELVMFFLGPSYPNRLLNGVVLFLVDGFFCPGWVNSTIESQFPRMGTLCACRAPFLGLGRAVWALGAMGGPMCYPAPFGWEARVRSHWLCLPAKLSGQRGPILGMPEPPLMVQGAVAKSNREAPVP